MSGRRNLKGLSRENGVMSPRSVTHFQYYHAVANCVLSTCLLLSATPIILKQVPDILTASADMSV